MTGKKLSRSRAMKLMCAECMGYWIDGKVDCECIKCPLYFWQPYRKLEPDLTWLLYNPTTKGKKLFSETNRLSLSEEQREIIRERFKKRCLKEEI